MPRLFDDESSREFFSEKYSRVPSTAALKVEQAVLGHAEGLSGYTTMDQAGELCDRMKMKAGSRVLDLGSGRGWPGAFLARCMRCRLVFSDMPVEALRGALIRTRRRDDESTVSAIAADARLLPFRSETFDAIVHADVF